MPRQVLAGSAIVVDVDSVGILREKLEAVTGIPSDEQRLLLRGVHLDASVALPDDCTVQLLLDLRGGSSIDAAFEDLGVLRRCLHRVHRFSPGTIGRGLVSNGDRCAALGHWSLIQRHHVHSPSLSVDALHAACRAGRSNVVDTLLAHYRADINASDTHGWTPLLSAVVQGNEDLVRLLFTHGAKNVATSDAVRPSDLRPALWARVSGANLTNPEPPEPPPSVDDDAVRDLVEMVVGGKVPLDIVCRRVCAAVDLLGVSVLQAMDSERRTIGHWAARWNVVGAAASLGRYSLCRLCLEVGVDPDAPVDLGLASPHTMPPIGLACRNGRLDCARLLRDRGASDDVPANGISPSWVACTIGDVDRLGELVASGMEVDLANKLGETPLLRSVEAGSTDCARLLLDLGADIDRASCSGHTPLFVACRKGHLDCVRLLLARGASTEKTDRFGNTPLCEACQKTDMRCVCLLLEQGANASAETNVGGLSPLHIACVKGSIGCARLLLDHGANLEAMDAFRTTPVCKACQNGHAACARLLLDRGASDDIRACGVTPLWVACAIGDEDRARTLLDQEPTMVDPESRLHRPVVIASRNGHAKCLQLLLERGGNANEAADDRTTPLFAAARRGHVDCVQSLVEHGADVNWRSMGTTALHMAALDGRTVCVRWLLDHGAQADPPNDVAEPPLVFACRNGHSACALALFERGADPAKRGQHDKSPAQWARPLHPQLADAMELVERDRQGGIEQLRCVIGRLG